MIDFHTHILPGIDDGSKDIDMTREMLEMERDMGVGLVIATPHFYAHRNNVDKFLADRDVSLIKVKKLLSEYPELPEVRVGTEVYYFPGMGRAEQIRELAAERTNVILLELPFRPWERSILDDISELKRKHGLRVILAHVERYRSLQKDKELYDEILDQGDMIQMNAGSFIEAGFLKRKQLFKILDSGRPVIIGSDCHNTTSRKPNLGEGLEIVEKKFGRGKIDEIRGNLEGLG